MNSFLDFELRYSSYPVESVDNGSFLDILGRVSGLSFYIKEFRERKECSLVIFSKIHGEGRLEVVYKDDNFNEYMVTVPIFTTSRSWRGEISNYISEITNRIYNGVKFVFEDDYIFDIPKFKNYSELRMKLLLIGNQ